MAEKNYPATMYSKLNLRDSEEEKMENNLNEKPLKAEANTAKPRKKKVPNVLSRFFFFWMFPLFYNGTRRDLDEEDLVPAKHIYDSKNVGDELEKKWFEEQAAAEAAGRQASYKWALYKAFFWEFIPGGIMIFMYLAIRTATPILFAMLLRYWSVTNPEERMSQQMAAIYALSMIVANVASTFFNHHGHYLSQQFGMKLRIASSTLMFRKIMRLNNSSLGETTAGKVVNLLANDLTRFDLAFIFLHYIWIIPIQVAAVAYLGYWQAGYSAIVGLLSLMVIALPVQAGLGRLIGKVRLKTAVRTDERIKVMSEVINGIQVIKMYAWEIPFEKLVSSKRANELKAIRNATYLRVTVMGFIIFTERIALFLTILTYILLGYNLSADVIFPLQQFIAAVQINITLVFPLILAFTAELLVSLKRVEEFLSLKEKKDKALDYKDTEVHRDLFNQTEKKEDSIRPLSYQMKTTPINTMYNKTMDKTLRKSVSVTSDFAIEVRDVSASWTGDPNLQALKNISLRMRKGKLCAVIGSVGSGKSSFLHLLLKELPVSVGTVSVNGEVSYASQEAWLFPSTVRENILFGLSFDSEKYKKVCKVCALEKDFKQLPFGDQTLVGERGVSLSGGQRARINLARCVYREADIYLLDDPLSAVDANVGRQLFEGCINGYLRNKTRILVTHQVHFVKAAEFIVVLNEGAVENMGTFDELASSGKDFSLLLGSLQEGKDKDSDSITSDGSGSAPKTGIIRSISIVSEAESEKDFEAQQMDPEERQSGNLKPEVLVAYFKAGGSYFFIFLTIFMVLISAASAGAADYWIGFWTNQMALHEQNLDGAEMDIDMHDRVGRFTTAQYLIIHAVIVLVCLLLTNLRVFPFVQLCVNASKTLHNNMFSIMLKGVMRFFDTSSSGRILNRFTKDMGALDEILPRSLLDVLQIYSTLLCILVLNAIALYWTLVPSFFLLLIFYFVVRIYMKTAQAVKRLEGTTKSPVFGLVSSSLSGIATIRSSGAESRLIQKFDESQDLHTSAWNGYLGGGVTFGFYLDALCIVYLAIVIFVFIYLDFDGIIPVGSVGLAVTQTNMLTSMLQHGTRMLVEFFAQLTSVERVMEYTRIDTEPNLFAGQIPISQTWPTEGNIVFQDVSLYYSKEEAPVLKNINLAITNGWKIGIVGRTGAGKSSLISALFRFAHIEGTITIDGVDTALVSRQELRSKISIIPQEPVLFSASIRYNLDPFEMYNDIEIWNALEQVDLKSAIPSLDFKVTEGGNNFSVGQRQLMCLARAVLRSNKILIMDEATANVDPQTDNFIQQTIRTRFASCTVLTIAHRLNTIMDSDKVLVMDSGYAAEFDHPYQLLLNPDSLLSSMVKETGDKMAAQLMDVAEKCFFKTEKENAG